MQTSGRILLGAKKVGGARWLLPRWCVRLLSGRLSANLFAPFARGRGYAGKAVGLAGAFDCAGVEGSRDAGVEGGSGGDEDVVCAAYLIVAGAEFDAGGVDALLHDEVLGDVEGAFCGGAGLLGDAVTADYDEA